MLELKNNIFYVGVKDPTLRTFDIFMETEYGTTYNAYLVKGEKTALIETAHEKLLDSYISNIEEIMPVSEIDYLICNHTEPDHSGSVKKILELNPDIEVVGSIAAIRNLKEITNMTFKEHIAKDGAELDLGDGKVLKFCIVPNLHWPDTMVTYLESEKTLFSCDVFGAHYCEDAVVDEDIIYYDKYEKAMKVYYDCIVSPFNAFVVKALEKLSVHLAVTHQITCSCQCGQTGTNDICRFMIDTLRLFRSCKCFIVATGIVHRKASLLFIAFFGILAPSLWQQYTPRRRSRQQTNFSGCINFIQSFCFAGNTYKL